MYLAECFYPSTPIKFKQCRAELVLGWVTPCEHLVCVVTRSKVSNMLGGLSKAHYECVTCRRVGYRGPSSCYPNCYKCSLTRATAPLPCFPFKSLLYFTSTCQWIKIISFYHFQGCYMVKYEAGPKWMPSPFQDHQNITPVLQQKFILICRSFPYQKLISNTGTSRPICNIKVI